MNAFIRQTLVFLISVFIVAEVDSQQFEFNKPISYLEYMSLNDSIRSCINYSIYSMLNDYYYNNYEFTTNVNDLFRETNKSNIKFVDDFLKVNKASYSVEINSDTAIIIYYQGHLIDTLSGFDPINCDLVSTVFDYRKIVRFFDRDGNIVTNMKGQEHFSKDLKTISEEFWRDGNTPSYYYNDSKNNANSKLLRYIIYSFDIEKGITIPKLCIKEVNCNIMESHYTKSVAILAEKYCKKYKIKKIVFAAQLFDENACEIKTHLN